MTPSNGIVEIRTLAELLSLYEIASDSTLAKDQYRNPLRPYRLIQPEASCQYQKNGKRCSQMHQHGFVVEPCSTAPEKYVAEIELALKQKYSAGGIRIAS